MEKKPLTAFAYIAFQPQRDYETQYEHSCNGEATLLLRTS